MTTLVLIDGSNVARCGSWRRHAGVPDDADLRRRLVDALASWAATAGHDVLIAFDGAGPWRPGTVRISAQVEVVGSGAAEGDDVLERLAAEARRAGRAHWLVSTDGALRQVAGAHADRVITAEDFVGEFTRHAASPVDAPRPSTAPATRLHDTLDDDVRARLERMRRGE